MNRTLEPLRHKNFRLLAGANTIDYLGNGIAPIALSFAVLDLDGSATDLGIVVSARTIANVALLLFGGVLADRLPRALVVRGSALLAAPAKRLSRPVCSAGSRPSHCWPDSVCSTAPRPPRHCRRHRHCCRKPSQVDC